MGRLIIVDASVIIAHFTPGHVHAERALDILDTEEELAMHYLTVAEVLVKPARVGSIDALNNALATLGVDTLPVDREESVELAQVRATAGVRMPDACVLSAALRTGSALATFDERLAHAAAEQGVERVLS